MIITSRQKIDGFYGVNINSPSPAYCKEMYIRESRGNNWDGYSLDEEKYINKITELANYHTQTVMLIAKAQYCLGLSSEEMLEELNATGFVLKGYDDIIDTEDYELTMAEHLTKIFNLLNVTDETQLKTIRLFSLLAPNTPIKKRDIKKWFELKSLSSINELVKYGWLNSSGSEYVSIHPVIADVVKYNNKPDFEFALPLINALQEEMKLADDYIKKNAVIVHANSVVKEFSNICNKLYADFLSSVAYSLYYIAQYSKSLLYYHNALRIQEKLKITDLNRADLYYDIGFVYKEIGKFKEALKNYTLSLSIKENELGVNHIDTATIYHSIGWVYKEQGNYKKALEMCNKALEIRKKMLGETHVSLAESFNDIAIIFEKQNKLDKALDYHKKSLKIRENILGLEHQETAESYNNIGLLYVRLKEWDNALINIKKAISIEINKFGKNHPNTGAFYNNLGLLYKAKRQYDYAEKYFLLQKEFLKKHSQMVIQTCLFYTIQLLILLLSKKNITSL